MEATIDSPAAEALSNCRPLFESPRFSCPRKIVNAAELVAVTGEKLMFTVTRTLSEARRIVEETESPQVIQAVLVMVTAVVATLLLII